MWTYNHKQVVSAKFEIAARCHTTKCHSVTDCKHHAFYHFVATGAMKDINWYRPLSYCDELKIPDFDGCVIFSFMRVCRERNYHVRHGETAHIHMLLVQINRSSSIKHATYDSDGEKLIVEETI